jgi:hypothetical protein
MSNESLCVFRFPSYQSGPRVFAIRRAALTFDITMDHIVFVQKGEGDQHLSHDLADVGLLEGLRAALQRFAVSASAQTRQSTGNRSRAIAPATYSSTPIFHSSDVTTPSALSAHRMPR